MTVLLLIFCGSLIGIIPGIVIGRKIGPESTAPEIESASANCKHRRWTKWKVEQLKAIHIYDELDDGKDLPDRVDSYMTRACLSCSLPQAKTVRGIDSPHYK